MTTRPRAMVALLALLSLVAAGCGGNGPDPEDNGPAPTEPGDDPGDLGLADPGVMLVGSDLAFPPFEFVEGGEEQGFDVELMREIGERLGVEVEFEDASFDTIFTQLAGGEFDAIISAITITEEREETIAFTDPYFEATQALVVTTDSDITGEDDLGDQDVGAQAGTTGLDYANENFTESRIVEFPTYPAAFTALEAGQIDAVLADLPAAVEQVQDSETLEIVTEIDTDEQYGIGVQQDNDALREAINEALNEIIEDGTYEELFSEWFPEGQIPERFRAGAASEGES